MKCFWKAIILVFLLLDIRIFPNLLYILLYVSSCNRWVEGLLAFQECDILHTIILIQVIYKLWMFHNFLNFFIQKHLVWITKYFVLKFRLIYNFNIIIDMIRIWEISKKHLFWEAYVFLNKYSDNVFVKHIVIRHRSL